MTLQELSNFCDIEANKLADDVYLPDNEIAATSKDYLKYSELMPAFTDYKKLYNLTENIMNGIIKKYSADTISKYLSGETATLNKAEILNIKKSWKNIIEMGSVKFIANHSYYLDSNGGFTAQLLAKKVYTITNAMNVYIRARRKGINYDDLTNMPKIEGFYDYTAIKSITTNAIFHILVLYINGGIWNHHLQDADKMFNHHLGEYL